MKTHRFDVLNALKVRWKRSGQDLSPVEGLDPWLREGLVEQRGTDRDPEFRLTRSGEMHLADGS